MGVLKEFYGDPPAGYLVLQTRMPGGGFERMDILVPARLKDQLEEEQLLREIRYEVEDQARRNARSKVVEEARRVEELALLGNDMDEDDNKKASGSFLSGPAKTQDRNQKEKRPGRGELDPEEEKEALMQLAAEGFVGRQSNAGQDDAQTDSGDVNTADALFPVYSVLEPLKLLNKTSTPDKETRLRNETLYLELKSRGNLRLLAAPGKDTLVDLKRLKASFPHFGEVVDLVARQVALHAKRHAAKVVRQQGRDPDPRDTGDHLPLLPPILLSGPPGVGKTRFTQELAMVLGIPVRRQAFDNSQSGSALLGSDRHWGNTHHGLVFEMLATGTVANPIVLLDEIDKCASSRQAGHPLASLHSLLESVTASRVKDLSLGMEINARHILWIATANDPALIEPSLRSRFREFWVNHPQGEAALVMAESISREIHAELNLDDMALPTKRITTAIAHLTAREQVSALKQSFAAAVADGREEIVLGDLPAEVRHELDQLEQTGKKDGPGSPGSGWLH